MPNVPWGNIFEVKTPALSELSNRIYTEERQREIYRQQQNRVLDDEFARNMSGIRDVDIGELTKRYGEYKLGYQQLLKRKEASPEEQLAVLRKKAAIYETLNKSKQEKAWEDQQQKQGVNDKKGIYADDWQDVLLNRRNTPLDKLNPEEDKKLLYPYSVPDLTKEITTARGAKRKVEIPMGVSKTDPLKDDIQTFEVGNTPKQFYHSLLNDVVTKNQSRNFAGFVNNSYSDEQVDDLYNRYNAKVNDPKFISVYGKPEPFTDGTRGMTDVEKAAAIKTMEEVVNLPEPSGKTSSVLNADRAMKARQDFAKEQQARAHKNSLARLYVYANIQDRKPEAIGRNIDNLIAQHIEDARNNNGEVITDNATFEAITGKKKFGSSVLMFDEPNNKYTYGTKDDTGKINITGEVPIDLGRIKLTKVYKSGLDAKYNTDKKIDVAPSTYMIKGKKYSEAELIKMGYSVDQIKPYKQ